jgi:hypothetical protein
MQRTPFKQEKKMESMKTIIENYASADEGQRLYMFLTHRDLREEFTTIDMAETNRPEKVPSKLKSEHRLNFFSGCCWGWRKHCQPLR